MISNDTSEGSGKLLLLLGFAFDADCRQARAERGANLVLVKWGSIRACQIWLSFRPRLVLLHKPARPQSDCHCRSITPLAARLGLPRIVACCELQRRLDDRHVALADQLNRMASVRAPDLNS